jgi:hypothetical protein
LASSVKKFICGMAACVSSLSVIVARAESGSVRLSCSAIESRNADGKMDDVDWIEIDPDRERIFLRATKSGDEWLFKNAAYDRDMDWVDKLVIFEFRDGLILSAGIRAKAVFGFNYNSNTKRLTYTFTNDKTPGHILFACL